MKNLIGKRMAPSKHPLAGVLIGLLSVCASLPVLAAPGDTLEPQQFLETNAIDQPAGSVFEYLSIAGSTFQPHDNSTTYSYSGSGCIHKTGGSSSLFAHKAILPDGAVVKFLRLYYVDTVSSNILAFFTTYDGAGNFNERTSVSSASGSSGIGSALSPEINFTVDRNSNAINIVANLGTQNDNTLQFCGVRIAYHAPITDRIFANGFDLTPL
ncbi:MAG TPA: hypothetical protein VFN25_05010 [Dokdonella sp.]|uniref:hypothetical protein n=1 Tax=Dokdonella sp. TaxID=2291710 RepID=UPI002D7F390A|nr:hypothetical protein [Dokdonella sp.]HET9032248.1 hypothetical protein [Dokdonella sp.]